MLVKIKVNGKLIQDDVQPQTLLLDWLRDHGCYSVRIGVPSFHTVHNPQFAVSQPLFTL